MINLITQLTFIFYSFRTHIRFVSRAITSGRHKNVAVPDAVTSEPLRTSQLHWSSKIMVCCEKANPETSKISTPIIFFMTIILHRVLFSTFLFQCETSIVP
jgi:hypothetical protein